MNPDFAIVLNFKLKSTENIDADFLVKTARNIGARAISTNKENTAFKKACKKYTIALVNEENGSDLTADNVINTMVENRKNGKNTVINIVVAENGKFDKTITDMLDIINNWMHMFGHAFNEGKPSKLIVDQGGFVLENRHANYQKYVFLRNPLPEEIIVSGIEKEPNRVEWIENRVELKFNYQDKKLAIKLIEPDDKFELQVLRIQAHRPEDDIVKTKF